MAGDKGEEEGKVKRALAHYLSHPTRLDLKNKIKKPFINFIPQATLQ